MASETANFSTELGRVHISNSIIRQAVEPELALERKFQPGTNAKGSIDISFRDGKVLVGVRVAVAYGLAIQTEAPKLQSRIKRAVEAITGLKVGKVAVNVERVFNSEGRESTSSALSKDGKS